MENSIINQEEQNTQVTSQTLTIDWTLKTFDESAAAYLVQNMGTKSQQNWDSTKALFFQGKIDDNESNTGNMAFKTDEVNLFLEQLPNIPQELNYIYKILGDPNVEFYFKYWTLFSLDKVIKRYSAVKSDGQERIVDFAIKNAGFGHCVICAYDISDNNIFYRHDGGSSQWDRELHYDFVQSYIPDSRDKLDFTHFLNEIQFTYTGPLTECYDRLPLINSDVEAFAAAVNE